MEAVKESGHALRQASVELKSDREIVMAAVKENGTALEFASVELWADRDILIAAVAQSSDALQHSSSLALRTGRLKAYLEALMRTTFNVPKQTFIATVLFAAKAGPPPDEEEGDVFYEVSSSSSDGRSASSRRPRRCDRSQCPMSLLQPSTFCPASLGTIIKQLIWDFAGVRSGRGVNGPRWLELKAAAEHLGVAVAVSGCVV